MPSSGQLFCAEACGYDESTRLLPERVSRKAFQKPDASSSHEKHLPAAVSFSRSAGLGPHYYRERLLSTKITSFPH